MHANTHGYMILKGSEHDPNTDSQCPALASFHLGRRVKDKCLTYGKMNLQIFLIEWPAIISALIDYI